MSKVMQLFFTVCIVSLFLASCGPSREQSNKESSGRSSEFRLVQLVNYELVEARKTHDLPTMVYVVCDLNEQVNRQELQEHLTHEIPDARLLLTKESPPADAVSLKVDEFKIAKKVLTAKMTVQWGARKGYIVQLMETDGSIRREVLARL